MKSATRTCSVFYAGGRLSTKISKIINKKNKHFIVHLAEITKVLFIFMFICNFIYVWILFEGNNHERRYYEKVSFYFISL
jgi:hypothetical protein